MSQTAIDTVVFDLGNVLFSFNPRWLYRKLLPDEAGIDRFFSETGFDAWNARMDAGLSFAEGIAAQSARFPQYRPLFEEKMVILFFIGFLVFFIGGIGTLIAAFRTSIWWGLGCLFIAPVSLLFLITNWGNAKNPFFLQLVGVGIMLLSNYA